MEEIIAAAKVLGEEIARSSLYIRYSNAYRDLNASASDMVVLDNFTRLSRDIKARQEHSEPVGQDEMNELNYLAQKAYDSEIITEYLSSQAEFFNLMGEIFGEIDGEA